MKISWIHSYKEGKVIAKRGQFPNFYIIRFVIPKSSRGEILSIGGAKESAIKLSNSILGEFQKDTTIDLEDAAVDYQNGNVELFMVSNDFAEQDRFSKVIKNKIK